MQVVSYGGSFPAIKGSHNYDLERWLDGHLQLTQYKQHIHTNIAQHTSNLVIIPEVADWDLSNSKYYSKQNGDDIDMEAEITETPYSTTDTVHYCMWLSKHSKKLLMSENKALIGYMYPHWDKNRMKNL